MTVTEVVTVDGGFTVQGSGYVPVGAVIDSAGNETSFDQASALGELVQAGSLCNDAALRQCDGQLLLVPQFTLAADTNSGNRPSFTPAAPPVEGERLFNHLVGLAAKESAGVQTGVFGADMKVHLVNDGPVTFWLQVPPAA